MSDVVPSSTTASGRFELSREKLCSLVSEYGRRTLTEDVDALSELKSTQAIASALKTNHVSGLTSTQHAAEKDARIETFGENRLPKRQRTPFWALAWEAAEDFTLRLLFFCGLVSMILGLTVGEHPEVEWIEGFAIWVAVFVVIFVTASNDYSKEKQFEKLNASKEDREVTVIRDGEKKVVSVFDIVVGDILFVEMGDEIICDCFVSVATDDFKIDESSLTGEPDPILKNSLESCIAEKAAKADKLALMKAYLDDESKKHLTSHAHHTIASPIVLSGTTVLSGNARLLVVAVGRYSKAGEMMMQLSIDAETTPLQDKLEKLAMDIGKMGVVAALITVLVLIISYWIMYSAKEANERDDGGAIAQEHINALFIGITIIAVAVPEGLPLAVTISLAYSINKMLKDQNWVRRLQACETMGSATEICSDKTGTLTKNRMTVQAYWNGARMVRWDIGFAPTVEELRANIEGAPDAASVAARAAAHGVHETVPLNAAIAGPLLVPGPFASVLMQNIAVNSTGFLEVSTVQIEGGNAVEEIKHNGSPTECALLQFARALGCDYLDLREQLEDNLIHREQFTSDRKIMTTIVRCPDNPALYRVYVKGASERVLELCNRKISKEGDVVHLVPGDAQTASEKQRIESLIISPLASNALRTICLAYKDFDPAQVPNWKSFNDAFLNCENDLICLGITGIRDPVRDEVPSAVATCQRAGINVRMVTGDNIETARQIAKNCGILTAERNLAMLGKDFYKLIGGVVCKKCQLEACPCPRDSKSLELMKQDPANKGKELEVRDDVLGKPEEFEKIKDTLSVLARSQPNDKYALVTGLRNVGCVVAVTGDGTNDAPALKKADVGFAMGIAGKEVAKQAADIVLLDDNFNSIVSAVKWGRNIYDNIQRFLQFQLTVNVVAVLTAFLSAVLIRGSPLSAIQLLWVNLIMDSFASLALATEPPTEQLLNRMPVSRDDYLITKLMWRNIIGHAVYQLVVMMVMVFTGDQWIPEDAEDVAKLLTDAKPEDLAELLVKMKFTPDEAYKLVLSDDGDFVKSGRDYEVFSDQPIYHEIGKVLGASRNYTVVFNTFVYMQVFNLINSRKIRNEINVFEGITNNSNWVAIFFFISALQAILVEVGSRAFKVSGLGLTPVQWLICLGFGAFSLVWAQILRFIPFGLLPETGNKPIDHARASTSIAHRIRGNTTSGQYRRQSSLLN